RHVVTQVEGVGEAVLADLPGLGERRDDLAVDVDRGEPLVDVAGHRLGDAGAASDVALHAGRLVGRADDDLLLGGGGRVPGGVAAAGAGGESEGGDGGEGEDPGKGRSHGGPFVRARLAGGRLDGTSPTLRAEGGWDRLRSGADNT